MRQKLGVILAVCLCFAGMLGAMGCPASGENAKSNPDKVKPRMY